MSSEEKDRQDALEAHSAGKDAAHAVGGTAGAVAGAAAGAAAGALAGPLGMAAGAVAGGVIGAAAGAGAVEQQDKTAADYALRQEQREAAERDAAGRPTAAGERTSPDGSDITAPGR